MINTLNANRNVGRIWIGFDSYHQWNSQIVRLMINRYTNVYFVEVDDVNGSVDH